MVLNSVQLEHKFRHGFRDILNPLCPCSIEAETTTHYFLRCHFYNANRSALMNELNEIDSSFSTLNEDKFTDLMTFIYYYKRHIYILYIYIIIYFITFIISIFMLCIYQEVGLWCFNFQLFDSFKICF